MIKLNDREKDILEMRGKGMTYEEIGKKYRVTGNRIMDIYKKANYKLRLIENAGEILKPDGNAADFAFLLTGSGRIRHCLFYARINTVRELAEFDGDVYRIRNAGKKMAPVIGILIEKARTIVREGAKCED